MTAPGMTNWIGYGAAVCTTLAFVPQAVRVWRTRSARDISLTMYLTFICGIVLWAVYGIRIHSWPVIVANAATLLLAGAVLAGKFRFRKPGG
jgi:MtN3 and saliva related transmembrane protein